MSQFNSRTLCQLTMSKHTEKVQHCPGSKRPNIHFNGWKNSNNKFLPHLSNILQPQERQQLKRARGWCYQEAQSRLSAQEICPTGTHKHGKPFCPCGNHSWEQPVTMVAKIKVTNIFGWHNPTRSFLSHTCETNSSEMFIFHSSKAKISAHLIFFFDS